MKKFLLKIKELIMKAAHFILNTDYVTSQNDDEITVSVSVPSSFSVPANTLKEFKASKTFGGSGSKDWRCYLTSTAFNYALAGVYNAELQFGSDYLYVDIRRDNDKFELVVRALKSVSAKSYSGTAQTITAHIQTFIDPFQT